MKCIFAIMLLLFVSSSISRAGLGSFAFWKRKVVGPCDASQSPAIGTVCTGGALYAGQFNGYHYMVTPSGCNDSPTPTCSGGTDTVTRTWYGTGGSDNDIGDVDTIAVATGTSTNFGNEETESIINDASTQSDSAADFCAAMSFGGYNDWHLPTKSELAYLYCHANVTNHSASNPPEDPNCATYGGKTSELTGFSTANLHYYVSTTEETDRHFWRVRMYDGQQVGATKGSVYNIRCMRRVIPIDYVPDPFSLANFSGLSTVQTISGIHPAFTIRLNASHTSGTPSYEYSINGTNWVSWSVGSNEDVNLSNNDTIQLRVNGTTGESGSISITNLNNGGNLLSSVTGTVPACSSGSQSLTTAGSHTFTPPSGCTSVTVSAWGGGGGGAGDGASSAVGGAGEDTTINGSIVAGGGQGGSLNGGSGGAGGVASGGDTNTNGSAGTAGIGDSGPGGNAGGPGGGVGATSVGGTGGAPGGGGAGGKQGGGNGGSGGGGGAYLQVVISGTANVNVVVGNGGAGGAGQSEGGPGGVGQVDITY